ncbi:enoyl-CoA hydratase/isomerase family protein [Streptosporangium sp. NPDC087985]|uniref:enoyl-CoA hydratase/isomerase family protein n=1 Tax=Streptosporangium sp. NPDC087985 TaxID=3366196 RepID=UPI00382C1748
MSNPCAESARLSNGAEGAGVRCSRAANATDKPFADKPLTIGQCPDQYSLTMDIASNNRSDAELSCERDGSVAVLRLNRPAARNALSSGLVEQLSATLTALDDNDEVRVAVLAAAPPGFCAGSDLKELAGMSVSEMVRHEARTGHAVRAIQQLGIPVIAAVEGFALGGGFLLATGCDVVVTADNARWHLPEVQLGWVPPWGLQTLIARVGPVTARRLAWGDQPLTGRDLYQLGAVDDLAEPGQALQRACQLAARLAALPPRAVASTKRALADATVGSAEVLDVRTTWMFGEDCMSETAQASLTTFARKTLKERQ